MSITCRTSISTIFVFFFFNNPAPPNFSTLSLHDALPIWVRRQNVQPYIVQLRAETAAGRLLGPHIYCVGGLVDGADPAWPPLSYAVASVGQVALVVKALKRDNVDLIKGYVGLSHSVLERLVEEGRKVSLRVIVDQWQRNGSPDLVEDGIYGFGHVPKQLLSTEKHYFILQPTPVAT